MTPIEFSCPSCQTKLRVKPELAGNTGKCPTCKKSLSVPSIYRTQDCNVPQQIVGEESSLSKLGHEGGVTLDEDQATGSKPTTPQKHRSVKEALERRKASNERYVIENEIARGGMGAVLRAVDGDLRREVAVKYMLDAQNPNKKSRFIEEAQINAQLEHPNIVPVYDLRVDAQQRPYLMMKLVKGRDLKSILDELRENPLREEKDWTLGRLLNVLINVCNGLAFAHAHGVVHRDLKPANIMLGDFGEVYVMDWGLAKVLKAKEDPLATVAGNVVTTNREVDLTQEGAVLGTPVYMPPEQATGQLRAIDQRSDVYALGAILYEVLTLQPPIDKNGGYTAVLMRVVEGQISPPDRRDPQRAKSGKIPKELTAVAMKALALKPEDRYPTVAALRRDIELFQEGRAVSAKQDTNWEMVWKLAKRNKGASAGLVGAMLVLLTSIVVLFSAWQQTRDAQRETASAYADLQKKQAEKEQAQKEKREQMRRSVPTLLNSARYSINQRNFKMAADQVSLALEYDPASADAHLLKAQLLLGDKNFGAAQDALAECLRLRPQHPEGRAISAAVQKGKSDDAWVLFALSDELSREQLHGLAALILESAGQSLEARKKLLPIYRSKIEETWPGLGKQLSINDRGDIHLNLAECQQVVDLKALQGMLLTSLDLTHIPVQDLTPLQGMPLRSLSIAHCGLVKEVTALKGMPLEVLNLFMCEKIHDLEPLRGMPLTVLNLGCCIAVEDLEPLAGMRLTELNAGECKRVRKLMPLKGMPLRSLNLHRCGEAHGVPLLQDLQLLHGMSLTELDLGFCCSRISDLTPLKGMPLRSLNLTGAQVRDLTPLSGMPLVGLFVQNCGELHDLTPLNGMKLERIAFDPKRTYRGMEILRRMESLRLIHLGPGSGYSSAEYWKKYDAGELKE